MNTLIRSESDIRNRIESKKRILEINPEGSVEYDQTQRRVETLEWAIEHTEGEVHDRLEELETKMDEAEGRKTEEWLTAHIEATELQWVLYEHEAEQGLEEEQTNAA